MCPFFDNPEEIGGGIIGAGLGGALGAKVGAWAGKALGGLIRGRESPEQYVDKLIESKRVPSAFYTDGTASAEKPISRARLIIAEQQSRGAGAVIENLKRAITDAETIISQNRIAEYVPTLQSAIAAEAAAADAQPGQFEYHRILTDAYSRLLVMIQEVALENPGGGVPPRGGGGGGLGGGGRGGGGLGQAPPAPKINVPVMAGLAVGLVLLVSMRGIK